MSVYVDVPAHPADRPAWLRQTLVGLVMLPLSLVPFAAYLTTTAEGRLLARRADVTINDPTLPHIPRGEATWIVENAPDYDDEVAVLVYHGIGESSIDDEAGQTLTPDEFGEHMAALRLADMTPITASQMAAACATGAPLPAKSVMVTFDDGRAEAMMFADPLLRQADMVATMFVIAGSADAPGVFYAGWQDLRRYAESGRWDLQGHTAALHDVVPDSHAQLPLLVNRLDGEGLDEWRSRIRADLDSADDMIAEKTGMPDPVAFADPFGAWGGDDRTNDPRIAGELQAVLDARYLLAFHQDEQASVPLASCDQDRLNLRRLDVKPWSGPQLIAQINAMAERPAPVQPGLHGLRPRGPAGSH